MQMGRTNIVLDDRLVKRAMRLTGARTKHEVVNMALRDIVARRSLHLALRRLKGTLRWEGDVDTWRRSRR